MSQSSEVRHIRIRDYSLLLAYGAIRNPDLRAGEIHWNSCRKNPTEEQVDHQLRQIRRREGRKFLKSIAG